MRTLIANGTIVTATGSTIADVLIEDETIAAIGSGLAGRGIAADETIDAGGRYVIPGAIDVHTHMELPFGGTFAKDTFETGTRAAAFGGTTCIVDFAVQSRGKSLREGLDAWHAKAEGNAVADYGFHMIMSDVNDDTLAEMDGLVAEGVPDFKLFTAYPGVFYSDDGAIFRAMQRTAKNGGLIMMHAENGMAIDVVAADEVAAGHTDPYYHGVARYPIFEGEATNRVIRLAEAAGVPVYIVHLSARDALNAVREARDRGVPAFAETCPQYLFLSLDDMKGGFNGAKFVCSPPLRPADHQADLWTGLVKDDLQLVSTDHCPFDFEGQKDLGKGDFRKVPNGLPGVEDRVDLLHDGGVVAGRITKERWVEIISTAPARLFGMYPRKGAVAVGADADLVVYDPNATRTISATTHHMDVDYSCYEGRQVRGRSDVVLSRGSVVVRNGEFTGRKGHGRFVRRATADFARAGRPRHRKTVEPGATRSSPNRHVAVERRPADRRRRPMRYLFLLWGDEAAELALPAPERQAIVERHMAFTRAIRDEGREVSGEPLGPSPNALIVRRNGSVTDGPYLETKEQLGGFYLIECRDRADAAAVAARIPTSPGLEVEIREIPA